MSNKIKFIEKKIYSLLDEDLTKVGKSMLKHWQHQLVLAELEEFDQQNQPGDLLDQFIEHRERKTEKVAWEEEKKDEYQYGIHSIMKCMSLTLSGFPVSQQMSLVNIFNGFLFQECHTE